MVRYLSATHSERSVVAADARAAFFGLRQTPGSPGESRVESVVEGPKASASARKNPRTRRESTRAEPEPNSDCVQIRYYSHVQVRKGVFLVNWYAREYLPYFRYITKRITVLQQVIKPSSLFIISYPARERTLLGCPSFPLCPWYLVKSKSILSKYSAVPS